MVKKVEILQGAADTLSFRIKDEKTRQALNLTGATFLLWVKRSPEDVAPLFVKEDAAFIKTAVASGYVSVFLNAYDTFQGPWVYKAELKATLPADQGGNIRIIKLRFELEILESETPNNWILQPAGIGSLGALGTPVVTIS